MKLREAINVKQLNEAARFGNKEMKTIERFSNDFKIGVEYEFVYNEDVIESEIDINEPVVDYETLEQYDAPMAREIFLDIQDQVVSEIFDEGESEGRLLYVFEAKERKKVKVKSEYLFI